MSVYLNADKIFQMGIEIETNGQRFYETRDRRRDQSYFHPDPEKKGIGIFQGMIPRNVSLMLGRNSS
jgi:hypothetical protein